MKQPVARHAVPALVLLWLAPPSAGAQPALDLEQAVARALARAPELQAAREQVAGAEARVGQARAIYWPRATLEASYLFRWPENELPIDIPASAQALGFEVTAIDDVHHFRAGAALAMRLLDPAGWARVDAARLSVDAEQVGVTETRASLAFRVRATYLAALLAADLERIARDSLEVSRAEERRAELRLRVGEGSELSLAAVRVRAAELAARAESAKNEHARRLTQLASLLGEPRPPRLSGTLEQLAGPVSPPSPAQSPAVQKLRAGERAAEAAAIAGGRWIFPTLGLRATAEVEYPHALSLEWGPLMTAGASLAWTFFDGFLGPRQTDEARARARGLGAAARAAEEQTARDLADLAARRKTAETDLQSARQTLEQAQVYLRVARAAEQAGAGTQLEVNTAELGQDRARVAVQRALFDLALVRAETLRLAGGPR